MLHTGSRNKFNEPVDLVYLWVDGSDSEWLKKKQKYSKDAGVNLPSSADDVCRFRDNNELKMSLRSVEKHLPWINKIYIVTDNQIPEWLDTSNPKIKVVFHQDFMPKEILPTYNSTVIEMYLHKIPNLSEHFLYANDDMFVNCDLSPDFFYTPDGNPIIRLQKSKCRKKVSFCLYSQTIVRMQNLIKEKFGKFYNFEPHHNIDAYTKKLCFECAETFKDEYTKNSLNRFRSPNDIQRTLISLYALATNQATIKVIHPSNTHLPFGTKLFNQITGKYRTDSKYIANDCNMLLERFKWVNPKLFCLNDIGATAYNLAVENQLLQRLYPLKSSFELYETPYISIIVPVYNVEEYLRQCLDSLINQTMKNIEIICINDGSTDNSLKILNEYAEKDNRIVVINQENKGVSSARNLGLEKAKGKYVMFVDADDWLETEACENIYLRICADNSDVLVFAHYNVFTNKKKPYNLLKDCNDDFIKCDNTNELVNKIIYIPVIACCKLYRREFISDIRFNEDLKISEDHLFWYDVLAMNPQTSILNKPYYNYRNIRTGSSMEKLDASLNRYKTFEKLVLESKLYTQSSESSKQLIRDRNLNFYLWMWIKHKNQRDILAEVIKDRLKNCNSNEKNYKIAEERLMNYKKQTTDKNKYLVIFGHYIKLKTINNSENGEE